MGDLWGVLCEDSLENWPRYNDTALYVVRTDYNICVWFDIALIGKFV